MLSGFSLLELIVTVAVSGVLLAIAVPSYRNVMASSRLTTAANEFVAAVNVARLEAIKRNAQTQICSDNVSTSNGTDTLGTACGTAAGAVYAIESDGVTTTKLYNAPVLPSGITLGTNYALRYRGQGLARTATNTDLLSYTGLLVDLSTDQISTGNHRCLYVIAGSTISSCTYSSGCPIKDEPTTCQ